MDFIDLDTNLQNHSMPIQDIFEEDSSINIYKKITGEVLRIIFKGILKYKNIIKKNIIIFLITIIGFEDVLVYCPKKQGCNLIPLRPIRHEIRYHLIIEANINNYLYRTITVRSPLLVKYIFIVIFFIAILFYKNFYCSFEMKLLMHWVFITRNHC